jgi:hypothetical protein
MALLQKGYLGATPLFRNEDWFENDARLLTSLTGSVNSPNITVTANSSAHTKGSWSELIASTSANASLLVVGVDGIGASATNTATLIDIGTGASGSETVVAGDIAVGGATSVTGATRIGALIILPLKIPASTRIAARIQSVVTGGQTASVRAYVIDTGDYATAPTTVDVIGTSTAASKGTEFSGASGTWVEGVASTSQAYRAVGVVLSIHDADVTGNSREYTLGVGAGGSEVEFGTLVFETTAAERASLMAPFSQLFGRSIPAGSRLAVKHNIAANPSRYGFTLIGIP